MSVSIADERAEVSARLAPLLDASAEEVEAAIVVFYERPPLERRNLVSVLATAEHFQALLSSLGSGERRAFLANDASSATRRDKAPTGEPDRVSVAICDQLAGPRVFARLCVRADRWRIRGGRRWRTGDDRGDESTELAVAAGAAMLVARGPG